MNAFIKIEEPVPPALTPGVSRASALWALGFRPFYLLASGFAALSIALWALQFSGWLGRPYLPGPMWHAHEMLFGFTLAVVVGFLLTAGSNWSGRPTLRGKPLAALALLWLAGRVLVLTPFGWTAALVNCAFPLCAALALGVPFYAARNRRNYFFVGLLLLLALAQLGVHLAQLEVLTLPGWAGIQVALDVVLFIMTVMAGRVIPMFTNNGVRGAQAVRQPRLEPLVLGSTLAVLAADLLRLPGLPLALLLGVCGAAHLARWALWRPWKTLRVPIVWILHAAYAWIPLHLMLRALSALGWIGSSVAVHALTVGAIGALVMGMMTRTARGHTGLPLQAGRAEITCYAMVLLAALVRVFLPMLAPAQTILAVLLSAALWSSAFGLYFVRYWPLLTRPRVDGRAG